MFEMYPESIVTYCLGLVSKANDRIFIIKSFGLLERDIAITIAKLISLLFPLKRKLKYK